MNNKLVARFAALYAGLALVVIAAGLGAYAAYKIPSKASRAEVRIEVKKAVGDQNLIKQAEEYAANQAQAQGITLVEQKVEKVTQAATDAKVYLLVTATGGIKFHVTVTFKKSVWGVSGFGVRPAA